MNEVAFQFSGTLEGFKTLFPLISATVEPTVGPAPDGVAAIRARLDESQITVADLSNQRDQWLAEKERYETEIARRNGSLALANMEIEQRLSELQTKDGVLDKMAVAVETLRDEVRAHRDAALASDRENKRLKGELAALAKKLQATEKLPESVASEAPKVLTLERVSEFLDQVSPVSKPATAPQEPAAKLETPPAARLAKTPILPGNICHAVPTLLTVTGPKGSTKINSSLFVKVLAHMADGQMYGLATLRRAGGYADDDGVRFAFTTYKPALERIGLTVYVDKVNAGLRVIG